MSPFDPPNARTGTAATRHERVDVVLGFLAVPAGGVVFYVAVSALFAFLSTAFGQEIFVIEAASLMFVGVVQVLWVTPFVLWARRSGRTGLVQGALIAAAIVFFLNAACWGLIMGEGVRLAG